MTDHLLGQLKVGDDAVLEGTDGDDLARCTADHLARLVAESDDLLGAFADGDDGWLVENHIPAAHKDQGIGCTEIDSQVIGKKGT